MEETASAFKLSKSLLCARPNLKGIMRANRNAKKIIRLVISHLKLSIWQLDYDFLMLYATPVSRLAYKFYWSTVMRIGLKPFNSIE